MMITELFLPLSDFDQLPHNIPISATVADIEEKKGFIDYFVSLKQSPQTFTTSIYKNINLFYSCPSQMFVIEVRTKGGNKYLIYRRYREFFNLHQILEARYSPEDQEQPGQNTCVLPGLPGERACPQH